MLYSEVVKQFRLRKGSLERYYQIQNEWRVVEFAKDYARNYYTVQLGVKSASAHRVIACLNSKRDLPDSRKVYHIDGNSHNNDLSNISLGRNGNDMIDLTDYRLKEDVLEKRVNGAWVTAIGRIDAKRREMFRAGKNATTRNSIMTKLYAKVS